jgi:hypothetical protein
MADREGSSSTPWIAFLVGVILVALVAVGYFVSTNRAPQEEAKLEINMPEMKAPDIDLPAPPPAPTLPPAAEPAAPATP